MVTVAWVASVCRVSPRRLALDKKLQSHSALSPGESGGMSPGGAAGSNVWLANAIGCLIITGSAGTRRWFRDENSRQANPPTISTNTQITISLREDNRTSQIPFATKILQSESSAEDNLCVAHDVQGTLIRNGSGLALARQPGITKSFQEPPRSCGDMLCVAAYSAEEGSTPSVKRFRRSAGWPNHSFSARLSFRAVSPHTGFSIHGQGHFR